MDVLHTQCPVIMETLQFLGILRFVDSSKRTSGRDDITSNRYYLWDLYIGLFGGWYMVLDK